MQSELSEPEVLHEQQLTPPHSLGFEERLSQLLEVAGIHRRGFITFLVDSTGLSPSGARRIFDDKRPPKRKNVFLKLVSALTYEINARKEKLVSNSEVVDFLLENKPISILSTSPSFDISSFVQSDAVLTSQIILKIEEVARNNGIRTSTDIDQKMVQLIQFRILGYCFKNRVSYDDPKVADTIVKLLELAKQNLL